MKIKRISRLKVMFYMIMAGIAVTSVSIMHHEDKVVNSQEVGTIKQVLRVEIIAKGMTKLKVELVSGEIVELFPYGHAYDLPQKGMVVTKTVKNFWPDIDRICHTWK